jgi:hypothetical protein
MTGIQLTTGILKEHDDAPQLPGALTDTVMIESNNPDQKQKEELSRYPALIPWNPRVPKLSNGLFKCIRQI